MKKRTKVCLGLLCIVGAGIGIYTAYKNREYGKIEKLCNNVYQYSLYKNGKKYMAIGSTEEEAISKAKKEMEADDKR